MSLCRRSIRSDGIPTNVPMETPCDVRLFGNRCPLSCSFDAHRAFSDGDERSAAGTSSSHGNAPRECRRSQAGRPCLAWPPPRRSPWHGDLRHRQQGRDRGALVPLSPSNDADTVDDSFQDVPRLSFLLMLAPCRRVGQLVSHHQGNGIWGHVGLIVRGDGAWGLGSKGTACLEHWSAVLIWRFLKHPPIPVFCCVNTNTYGFLTAASEPLFPAFFPPCAFARRL